MDEAGHRVLERPQPFAAARCPLNRCQLRIGSPQSQLDQKVDCWGQPVPTTTSGTVWYRHSCLRESPRI